jgi:hypothetical protein
MQADRKKIGIFIIILGLVVIFLIIYFVFLKNKPTTAPLTNGPTASTTTQLPQETKVGTTTPGDAPRNYQKYDISKEPVHKTTGDDLGKISMSFASFLGTYSNQANYGNFTDVNILMTDNMKTWSDSYVASLKKQIQNQTYYGIVTSALIYKVEKFDDASGQAEILVTTQRKESTDKINGGTPYIQTLDLTLVKVNNEWLFDKAYWGKKQS